MSRRVVISGIGLVTGTLLAWGATRTLQSLLFGVGATDPATFSTVVGLLFLVALAACTFPALRASRVDPITVLRQEDRP